MSSQSRLPSWLWILCATQTCAVLVFLNFAGSLSLIQAGWQLSNAQAGAINAAGQAGYVLAVLLLSSLTDYVSAERIILGGVLWARLSNVAFALFAQDTSSAIFFRALTGLGIAGIYMPGVRLISQRIAGDRRGRAVGLFVASFTLGSAASIALGGSLAVALGWRNAFALLSIGPLLAAVIAWRALVRTDTTARTAEKSVPARPMSELLHNRTALLSIAAYSAHAWEMLGLRNWLPAFLAAVLIHGGTDLGEATRTGAALAGIATLTGAAATAASGAVSDRFGRVRTIKLIMSAGFIFTLGLGLTLNSAWVLVIGVALTATFLSNADSAIISTTLTESVPHDYLGRTLAIYSFSGFTAGAIAPLVFGATLDYAAVRSVPMAGSLLSPWSWAFATLAAASLVGLLTVVSLQRHLLRSRSESALAEPQPLAGTLFD